MEQTVANKTVLDYSMSIAEMLEACSHVGEVNHPDVKTLMERHFPSRGTGEVLMPSLEHLRVTSGSLGPELARKMLKEKKLRPATLPELMMYVVNNPEEASLDPVVALSPVEIPITPYIEHWFGKWPGLFVPVFTNYTRFHNGTRLVRPGTQVFNLVPEQKSWHGSRCSTNWRFAVVPEYKFE